VETADGLRLAVEIADLEEERGFRSSFNVGGWYDLDRGILRELEERGFEVGVHGLRHDRSLFSSRAAFEDQQPGLAALRERVGGKGFRSPATHRFFEWLGELPFSYDCSVPHSDPFEPQPGGCCSVWPFFVGSLVELPYTLPQDHTLFTLLGARSIAVWLEQVERLEAAFGLVQCVTHPDPGYLAEPKRRALYAEFLTALAERDGLWRALPSEVAEWWRLRDAGTAPVDRFSHGYFKLGETPTETLLQPPATQTEVDHRN
jgi:peptidoglycan/xylan/chitin deacetylase (PgdA/CDA1 family)